MEWRETPLKATSRSTSTIPAPMNKSLPFSFKMDFGLSFGGTKGVFPFVLGGGLPAAIGCAFSSNTCVLPNPF
jgi:hypothetical protein